MRGVEDVVANDAWPLKSLIVDLDGAAGGYAALRPLVAALAARVPWGEVHLLTREGDAGPAHDALTAALGARRDFVTAVVPWPTRVYRVRDDAQRRFDTLVRLRGERYAAAFDLTGSLSSAVGVWCSGARLRIAAPQPGAPGHPLLERVLVREADALARAAALAAGVGAALVLPEPEAA